MKTRDLKSLSETIASVVDPIGVDRAKALQEGYLNSLTEKARQVVSEAVETKTEDEVEAIMKRLAAKALKKAKKKARASTDDAYAGINPSAAKTDPDMKNTGAVVEELIYEVAAPGYEDWASDPKVKASFKKQYGKRWKEVMYGHSWNLAKQEKKVGLDEEMDQLDEISDTLKSRAAVKARQQVGTYSGIAHGLGGPEEKIKAMKMARKRLGQARKFGANLSEEELGLEEGVKRMRRLRTARFGKQGVKKELDAAYDKELSKLSASRLRRGGAPKQTVRAFFTDKPTTKAADKAYSKFAKDAMNKASAKGKKIFEDEQFDEAVSAKRMRIIRKYVKGNKRVPEHLKDYMERSFKKKRAKDAKLSDGRGAVGALETRMRRKSAALRARGVEPKGVAPGYLEEELAEEWGGGFQSSQDAQREVQAGLRRDAAMERKTKIADIKAVLAGKMTKNAFTKKHRTKFSEHPLTKKIIAARERRLAEALQLDEAGYKRLGRIKGAAYKAELASRGADPNTSLEGLVKAAKLKRAAAEQTAKVAAGMARRGGATPETVRNAGSRLSKKGKYTLKAGKLATQYDKAMRSFRSMSGVKELTGRGEDKSEKRARQQAQAAFVKKARTGDFGQDNQAALRARSNFEKRFGRLKGK